MEKQLTFTPKERRKIYKEAIKVLIEEEKDYDRLHRNVLHRSYGMCSAIINAATKISPSIWVSFYDLRLIFHEFNFIGGERRCDYYWLKRSSIKPRLIMLELCAILTKENLENE